MENETVATMLKQFREADEEGKERLYQAAVAAYVSMRERPFYESYADPYLTP